MARRLPLRWRVRTVAAALRVAPLINREPLERINDRIRGASIGSRDPGVDDSAIAELVDRLLSRLPRPWRRTPLKTAIVMHHLLRRAGRAADLSIDWNSGTPSGAPAHAWLICDDEPFLEVSETQVSATDVLATLSPAREAGK